MTTSSTGGNLLCATPQLAPALTSVFPLNTACNRNLLMLFMFLFLEILSSFQTHLCMWCREMWRGTHNPFRLQAQRWPSMKTASNRQKWDTDLELEKQWAVCSLAVHNLWTSWRSWKLCNLTSWGTISCSFPNFLHLAQTPNLSIHRQKTHSWMFSTSNHLL